ncbi:hypothetical protein DOTSEDRAFT_69159 [Dothistroma septosporum NZE10]|uniref:Uncharacterized protein n=1 Tax=Dothistroma septosporum (strain NZE10 / CBS 128990) TaxID=675120 RepID=N1PXG2_DOTSN|nr:hypothetical protein DOTSEDRAFT_69159 [Dothistroma septosporum NZE10]
MDYNDPSRRQYAANPYATQQQQQQQHQQQQHGSAPQTTSQYTTPGSVERFRQSSYMGHSPSTVPSTGRAGGDAQQVYPALTASAFAPGQPMQYGTELQGSDVSRQQDAQQYQQYSSNVMYGLAQQPQQATQSSYDPVQRYTQRPGPASETLASQFGAPQTAQYYLGAGTVPTSATMPDLTASHLPSQYQSGAYAQAGPSASQTYASAMIDPTASSAYPAYTAQYAQQSSQSIDQAFNNYQAQIRTIFSKVREGQLYELPGVLLDASHYLLGNAEALGLTRDDDNLHDERIRLWDEFNRAWLTTLQTQYDLVQESMRTSGDPHHPTPPQSIMHSQNLETLSRELVRLCDSVEKHGLVDYQMGVAEEEIMDLLLRCLSQLDPETTSNAEAGAESSASGAARGR